MFSDDDFAPTIDVLDSMGADDASLILDFDESGTKVVGVKSLSPAWQVTAVTSHQKKNKSSPGVGSASGSGGSSSAGTNNHHQSGNSASSTPVWAEMASETDSVAHVVYVDGMPAVRSRALTRRRSNNSGIGESPNNNGNADVNSLIRIFQERNTQLRHILASTNELQ